MSAPKFTPTQQPMVDINRAERAEETVRDLSDALLNAIAMLEIEARSHQERQRHVAAGAVRVCIDYCRSALSRATKGGAA